MLERISDVGSDIEEPLVPERAKPTLSKWLLFIILLPFYVIAGAIGLTLYLVFIVIFMVILLLLTITGIGPLLECYFYKKDTSTVLDRFQLMQTDPSIFFLSIPAGVNAASGGQPYKVMVRVTRPKLEEGSTIGSQTPPLIISNGLASNGVCLFKHQDIFTQQLGITTVVYDRINVGYSDYSPPNAPVASAIDSAREMDFVMKNIPNIPPDTKWLALGYSMGHIVLTAYMCCFPNRFVGYVNNDGIPVAFVSKSKAFLDVFAPIYKVYAALSFTGFMRCMLNIPSVQTWLKKVFITPPFTVQHIVAQMAQGKYWNGVVAEFFLMMSCTELVTACWGCLSALRMDRQTFSRVCRVAPNHTIRVDETTGKERVEVQERSPFELGLSYLSDEERIMLIKELRTRALLETQTKSVDLKTCYSDRGKPAVGDRAGGLAPEDEVHWLLPQFEKMHVSSLIARGSMPANELVYGYHMRNLNQIDHVVCTQFAKKGVRSAYLDLHHGQLCPAQPGELVIHLREMIEALRDEEAGSST